MAERIPFKWNTATFAWDNGSVFPNQSTTPFTWDDCALVIEAAQILGGAGDDGMYPLYKGEPEKRKKLIKLICTVKGKKYIEEKKQVTIPISNVDQKFKLAV